MHRSLRILLLVCVIAGCRAGSGANPADVEFGEDKCAECGNVISDSHFAAQYVLHDETAKKFDDPGCLFRALRREMREPLGVFFHEHQGDDWVIADDAWFAHTPETKTPRGYNWVAYATFGSAQSAVTRSGAGEILRFDKARERVATEAAVSAPRPQPPG
jgi:hypothetical protein